MRAKASWRQRGAAPWAVLIGFLLLWLLFFALTPPQGAGADVFVFRDAGYNWAQGRGLTATSVPHHIDPAQPRLFASYTPGAPLLFGIVASLFGSSASVDTFYNLALAALACFLLYACFSLAEPRPRRQILAAGLVGLLLPTGLVAVDHDRPEVPALCLLLAILLLWRRTNSTAQRIVLFACLGVVFLIHPFAGIAGWLVLLFLLIFNHPGEGSSAGDPVASTESRSARLRVLLAGTGLDVLIVAACGIFMWRRDHTILHRFLDHAAGHGTGVGVVLRGGSSFLTLFVNPAAPATAALAIGLLLSALAAGMYLFLQPGARQVLLEYTLLILFLVIFPLAVFPNQANYFGLSRVLLLAVLFTGGFSIAAKLRGSSAPFLLLLITFVFLAPWTGLEALKSWETRASYSSEQEQAKRVRAYFDRRGESNPKILVDAGHYFIYKKYFPNLHDLSYLDPDETTSEYQGLVLCYSSSPAFSRAQLRWNPPLSRGDWRLIEGGEDVVHVMLFGRPLMRRNWTWMCDVYVRR